MSEPGIPPEGVLYAEDIVVGSEFEFGTRTLTEAEIIEYARAWDPLPIHIDPVAAKDGPFGGVIASGLHTLAVYQRLMVEAFGRRLANKAGKELEIKMRRPVRPAMTLTGRTKILDVELRPARGDAILRMHSHLVDGDGNIVLEVAGEGVIFLRPARGA